METERKPWVKPTVCYEADLAARLEVLDRLTLWGAEEHRQGYFLTAMRLRSLRTTVLRGGLYIWLDPKKAGQPCPDALVEAGKARLAPKYRGLDSPPESA